MCDGGRLPELSMNIGYLDRPRSSPQIQKQPQSKHTTDTLECKSELITPFKGVYPCVSNEWPMMAMHPDRLHNMDGDSTGTFGKGSADERVAQASPSPRFTSKAYIGARQDGRLSP